MIDIFCRASKHQTAATQALDKGISEESRILQHDSTPNNRGRLCIVWGTRRIPQLRQYYKTIVVIERGYFNDRTKYYSFGIGGLNGRANFNNVNSKPDRWIKHGTGLHTWNRNGDYYLVMGQVSGDMSISRVNIDAWYRKVTDELLEKTDRPVYFRPHPLSRQYVNGLSTMDGDLSTALSGACGVITYNSNSGVDAMLAGVPTMAQDRGSMIWGVCAKSVNQLIDYAYPDRSQWAYNLAYTQWTLEELKDGTAWNHLCH
jgi:hypothetical protein